jgi:hypothetical protein
MAELDGIITGATIIDGSQSPRSVADLGSMAGIGM